MSARKPKIQKPEPNGGRSLYKSQQKSPTQKSPTRSPSPPLFSNSKTYLNDAECISLRDKLYEDPNMTEITSEDLTHLFQHLREYTYDQALKENYPEARKAKNLQEATRQELSYRNMSPVSRRPSQMTQRQMNLENQWKDHFDGFDEETDQKRMQMQQKHNEQLEEFEDLWANEMLRKYRKPSARLLQLKQQERALAYQQDFDKAEILHNETEALKNIEAEQAQKQLEIDYKAAKAQLLERQASDLQKYEDSRAITRRFYMTQYNIAKQNMERNMDIDVRRREEHSRVSRYENPNPEIACSYENAARSKGGAHGWLLPDLQPPNDPQRVEEEERRKYEQQKKAQQFSKRNAQMSLSQSMRSPRPPSSPRNKVANRNGKQQDKKAQTSPFMPLNALNKLIEDEETSEVQNSSVEKITISEGTTDDQVNETQSEEQQSEEQESEEPQIKSRSIEVKEEVEATETQDEKPESEEQQEHEEQKEQEEQQEKNSDNNETQGEVEKSEPEQEAEPAKEQEQASENPEENEAKSELESANEKVSDDANQNSQESKGSGRHKHKHKHYHQSSDKEQPK